MLLVIPVSLADRKQIPLIEKAFAIYPPGSGHKLLVVGSPNVDTEVKELAQKLCPHFGGNSQTFVLETDSNLGWPTACNYYAQSTAFYVQSILPPDGLWFWYELDCTPLRADWLDEIEAFCIRERMTAQRENVPHPNFFGVRERVCLEKYGSLMPFEEAGEQMAACGVYCADMAQRVITLRTVTATNIPWYTFIRWYILPALSNTALIQNNWRTSNYERNSDGRISCKSEANWAWDVHFNDDVRNDAVLLHGCKDGSLIELLEAEHEAMKGDGEETPISASEYWTDAKEEPEEPPAPQPIPRSYRKRKMTTEQVAAARKKLLAMHEKRMALRTQAK